MELLRILTLVYVAVLVAALAVSLIAILVWLIRISRALAEVKSALANVAERTKPLESYFDPIGDAPDRVEENMKQARATFATADESLHRLAERLGATEVTR